MTAPQPIRTVLIDAHRALDAFSIVAASMLDHAVVDGPDHAATRSIPKLLDALDLIDGELAHHIQRLCDLLTQPQGPSWDVEHYLRLAAGYADARRHLRVLTNYIKSRQPKAITE